jgi:ribosomal protein S18 acetylase RimI-like enzyme
MNDDLELRPATVADETFANDLLFVTMHRYVEATWPEPADQQHYYKINPFNPSNTWIIQVQKKDVGRLSKTVQDDCIFIDELHVLPNYQRMGIGRQILEGIFEEAREQHLPVKLTVLKVNCAQNLYLRMGFKVTLEKDHRLHMEWRFK